jgi:hypothetical protein
MRCRFGHDHPPESLTASTGNPTRPWDPRPYHCPDCSETRKSQAVGKHWTSYPTAAAARAAGHPRTCKRCFP